MERTLCHRHVPGLAGLVLEGLRCFLVDLQEDYWCFLCILAILPRFASLVLLPVVSRMLCNLSLCAWILTFHRRTQSVYDKVHLACVTSWPGLNRIDRILISTSCNFFSGSSSEKNSRLSVLGLERSDDG
jgi:hypothetical protein